MSEVWNLLRYTGLCTQSAKVLLLGIDNAGKTTLLHMLRTCLTHCEPTCHPGAEDVRVGKVRLRLFDLGGQMSVRRAYKEYLSCVDGIIFVVDAADPVRFPEVAEALWELLEGPDLHTVPIVVLGNKIDIPAAVCEDALRRALLLHGQVTWGRDCCSCARSAGPGRPVELFMTSVVQQCGFKEALMWFCQFLK